METKMLLEADSPCGYWDADVTPYSAAMHMIDLVRREERGYLSRGRLDEGFVMRQLAQNMHAAADARKQAVARQAEIIRMVLS